MNKKEKEDEFLFNGNNSLKIVYNQICDSIKAINTEFDKTGYYKSDKLKKAFLNLKSSEFNLKKIIYSDLSEHVISLKELVDKYSTRFGNSQMENVNENYYSVVNEESVYMFLLDTFALFKVLQTKPSNIFIKIYSENDKNVISLKSKNIQPPENPDELTLPCYKVLDNIDMSLYRSKLEAEIYGGDVRISVKGNSITAEFLLPAWKA